jgi:hypothetical protein
VRKRTLKRKNHAASGKQAAFEWVAIGRVATGAGRVRGSGDRGPSDPGAGYRKRGRIERLNIG